MKADPSLAPGKKLNVGCGRDVRPVKDGWVNLDGFVDGPDIIRHDILRFPWPFADATFDLVFCSHVLEHIPPMLLDENGTHRDVLFRVMEEMHRILRPGGLLLVRVPWGYSEESLVHPQHYRQWRPEWATFFHPDHIENYYSNARFRLEHWEKTRRVLSLRGKYFLRFGKPPLSLTNHIAVRFPFTRRLLYASSELELHMRKL